jgi:hypothetical protein
MQHLERKAINTAELNSKMVANLALSDAIMSRMPTAVPKTKQKAASHKPPATKRLKVNF